MRQRYLWRNDQWVEAEKVKAKASKSQNGPMVVSDISPYKSIITGEPIGGRRQHRDHLRAHGCIEIGNEQPGKQRPADAPPVRQDLEQAVRPFIQRHGVS